MLLLVLLVLVVEGLWKSAFRGPVWGVVGVRGVRRIIACLFLVLVFVGLKVGDSEVMMVE